MGGVLILFALTVSTLLWVDLRNLYFWVVLCVTLGYGALGFADDYRKLSHASHKGLSARAKIVTQALIGLVAAVCFVLLDSRTFATSLTIPVFKDLIPFGLMFPIFGGDARRLECGESDRRTRWIAIVPTIICAGVFALIAYLVGNRIFADYLQLNGVAGVQELAVFCSALIGAGLGFLWFNAPPAAVFMGDTGSLALGGALGAVAVATKHEIVLLIVGGLFVVETVSVIVQVFWYKRTGRRVFLMAPLHHHFEKKGWSGYHRDPFSIISMILAPDRPGDVEDPMMFHLSCERSEAIPS
jgi:phospho-N-acetylmuramoyl-pentapeptide-transferase